MTDTCPPLRTLTQHPATPSPADLCVRAACTRDAPDRFSLVFEITGPVDRIALPEPGPATRQDGLWQATCVEAFIRPAGMAGYVEVNLSPASGWAVYSFDSYRSGQASIAGAAPVAFNREDRAHRLALRGEFLIPDLGDVTDFRIGLSAVIALKDGTKSYWALAHPPGAPDFHHELAFAADL